MAKFVLVHGAEHGAWCWYKVASRLRQAGHSVVAVDLTSAGINAVDPNQVRTLAHYSQPLTEIVESIPQGDKIILVGHGYGGIVLTYVMEKYPSKCAAAVFVEASMFPSEPQTVEIPDTVFKESLSQSNPSGLDFYYTGDSEMPTSARVKPEHRRPLLYNLCPAEDVELANLLLKPHPFLPASEVNVEFTKENYGSIPRFYIKSTEHSLMGSGAQESMIMENPPDGVAELPCGSSPFFSTPDALVQAILSFTVHKV